MGKTQHSNKLPDNLPQLQNLIKRDSVSYKEEVSKLLHSLYYRSIHICSVLCVRVHPVQYRITVILNQIHRWISSFLMNLVWEPWPNQTLATNSSWFWQLDLYVIVLSGMWVNSPCLCLCLLAVSVFSLVKLNLARFCEFCQSAWNFAPAATVIEILPQHPEFCRSTLMLPSCDQRSCYPSLLFKVICTFSQLFFTFLLENNFSSHL